MARETHRIAGLVKLEAASSECNALIQADMITYDTGLPYHHTCAMVYAEVLTYLSTGMYVDTGSGVCQLGDCPRNYLDTELQQGMCETVVSHGCDGGITDYYFLIVHRCGVTVKHRFDVRGEQTPELWYTGDKFICHCLGRKHVIEYLYKGVEVYGKWISTEISIEHARAKKSYRLLNLISINAFHSIAWYKVYLCRQSGQYTVTGKFHSFRSLYYFANIEKFNLYLPLKV